MMSVANTTVSIPETFVFVALTIVFAIETSIMTGSSKQSFATPASYTATPAGSF
jgi:hypothetical protein